MSPAFTTTLSLAADAFLTIPRSLTLSVKPEVFLPIPANFTFASSASLIALPEMLEPAFLNLVGTSFMALSMLFLMLLVLTSKLFLADLAAFFIPPVDGMPPTLLPTFFKLDLADDKYPVAVVATEPVFIFP